VGNILPNLSEKITVTQFAERILEHMKRKYPEMREYHFDEEELQAIEDGRQMKFGNWNWNFGTNPVAGIIRERRYPAGKTQVFIDTKNGVIEDVTFYGTFFGVRSDLAEVQHLLKGVKYTPGEVRKRLSSFDISPYFSGFSIDELTDAIVG
jgi:lipoate-protein ligase A